MEKRADKTPEPACLSCCRASMQPSGIDPCIRGFDCCTLQMTIQEMRSCCKNRVAIGKLEVKRQMRDHPKVRSISLLLLLFFGSAILLLGKPSGPDTKLTGAFGESTCLECHSSHKLNEGRVLGGSLEIEGIPEKYEAGKGYILTIQISHPGQSCWGFEFSARSSDQGTQANRLNPIDSNTQVKEDSGVLYVMHTRIGTKIGTPDRASFSFEWVAPPASAGMILFNASGNAANGNNEPTGDYIYTASAFSVPAAGTTEVTEHRVKPIKSAAAQRLNETSILMNLPVPVDLAKGSIEIHVQHRFFQSIEDSSPGSAFGIDSGANINLGINYSLTKSFSAGISRTREDQLVSLTAAQEIHTQRESPWKMSLLGGVAGKSNFERNYSPFLQLATSFDYKMLRLNLVPTVIFNSRDETLVTQPGPQAVNPDDNNTFALGIGADFALNRRFSIVGEYTPRLAGFGGFFGEHQQLGGGVAIRTWGHVFSILVSRSRNFSPVRYAVDADFDSVCFGFNIYRRIR